MHEWEEVQVFLSFFCLQKVDKWFVNELNLISCLGKTDGGVVCRITFSGIITLTVEVIKTLVEHSHNKNGCVISAGAAAAVALDEWRD